MSVEHLNEWHDRSYGQRASGVVETEDRDISITVRQSPDWSPETNITYVLANGWTAGKNSMRVPAIEAAKLGCRAVTLEYTNTGTKEALCENVQDVVAVTKAQPGKRRSAVGLSMGGAVVTMALEQLHDLETVTVVAPGKYILPEYSSRLEIIRQFIDEAGEVTELGRNPLSAVYIGLTSAANCIRRPKAVYGEVRELLNGNVHDELRRAKASPNAPYIRFVSPDDDRLLPAAAQRASIAGLPFDEVVTCEGGHGRYAYDPSLAQEIFARDGLVISDKSHSSLPLAA